MSLIENAATITENVPKVYEAGKKAEWNTLWDSIQQSGTRKSYAFAFYKWDESAFFPKYDIRITGTPSFNEPTSMGCFRDFNSDKKNNIDLAARLEECGVVLDTSAVKVFQYFFLSAYFNRLPAIDISNCTNGYMAFYNSNVVTIDKLIISEATVFGNNMFQHVRWLVNLTVEGTIGKNGLNLSWSTKLSHDSLMSIINALKDYSADTSGTVWKVTLGTENYAKLTDEELAIAEEKGWVVE